MAVLNKLMTRKPTQMAKLETQIQLRKTVKPAAPTPNHLRSLKLSLFDQVPPEYSGLLFHYLPNVEWNRAENDERCGKLQDSLAEMLVKFYPLAGRYRKDDLSIQCNDGGVEYVESKMDADLAEFLHQGPEIELLDDLLPWRVPPKPDLSSSPLLGIQVNKFNCGGLVVGLQISHFIADAFTIGTFVGEWAHITKTGRTTDCLPSFGQLSSLLPARVPQGPEFSLPTCPGAKIITRRFVFDALAITELRDKIDSSSATMVKSTRVVAIMSLIWKILTGISSSKHGHSRDSTLIFAMNLRGKTKLVPSSELVLGNFCTAGIATLEANQSREELNDFVSIVKSASRDTSSYIGEASVDDVSSMFASDFSLGQNGEMDLYLCSSWCRFPWYEVDFGWGKPSWVSPISEDTDRSIILMDTKDGDGIEVWVSLKENDMVELEKHPDILTFCQG